MTPDAGNTPDSGSTPPTTLTATGAVDGGITAPAPIVGYDSTGDMATFSTTQAPAGGLFGADVNFTFGGRPMAQAYTTTSTGFGCDVTVTSGSASTDTWVARFNTPQQPNKGTCSLTLTSESVGSQGYQVHGSLSVSAENMGGAASGTVNLSGTF